MRQICKEYFVYWGGYTSFTVFYFEIKKYRKNHVWVVHDFQLICEAVIEDFA